MNFREMMKLYQEGTLGEQEAQMVKEEIEKHEVIGDYLYETSQISALEEMEPVTEGGAEKENAEAFSQMVRKTIRKAFVKMGVIVGAVLLAVVLAVIFLLPNVVSAFYYNPGEVVGTSSYGAETNRMSLDLAVYSELYMPGGYRDAVIAEDLGYGKYRITIPQTTSYDGNFDAVAGTLERNELTLYNPNLLKRPTGNAFVLPEEVNWSFRGMGAAGTVENAFASLQELDDRGVYVAYFSLDALTDYETVYSQVGDAWFGVYNEAGYHAGFWSNASGRLFDWDREKYPLLSTLDSEGDIEEMEANAASGKAMQTHFLSMLRYMQDHPEVMKMFDGEEYQMDEIISYVEVNGLQIYGFAVVADKTTIMELAEAENIAYVYTQPYR